MKRNQCTVVRFAMKHFFGWGLYLVHIYRNQGSAIIRGGTVGHGFECVGDWYLLLLIMFITVKVTDFRIEKERLFHKRDKNGE